MAVPARGALTDLYTNSDCPDLLQLRDKGWCVLRGALDNETVKAFVSRVDAALERDGFAARFGKPMSGGMRAGDLPKETFWSIDTIMYPLSDWAIDLRIEMRRAFAKAAGIEPTTLASSFDGVMIKDGKFAGPNKKALTEYEVAKGLIPCNMKNDRPGGPTHCDQNRYRRRACESHQLFCPLVVGDLSTILLVPKGEWTLQGVMDALTERFPEDYVAPTVVVGRRRARDHGDKTPEGYDFDPVHRDFLLSIEAVELIKPLLNAGDILAWSSAVPHCSGKYDNGKKAAKIDAKKAAKKAGTEFVEPTDNPRLGLISAYVPKSMVSEQARVCRLDVVGRGFCTGQQILYPSKHGSSDFVYVWKQPEENVPQVYKEHRKWRVGLRATPLWQDRTDDTEAETKMRANLRCLLG